MESVIKTGEFGINFDWLSREYGRDLERACFSDLSLSVGDSFMTRLEDVGAKTVRNQTRACAYHLAIWLAGNWWRLRWEPEPQNLRSADLDWKMAHSLSSAGGGYVWPDVIFSSEGSILSVLTRTRQESPVFEPVNYLANFHAWITASDFERTVDRFIEGVIERLRSFSLKDEALSALWENILQERRDSDASQWRKFEALAGFDPNQAPNELIEGLIGSVEKFGQSGVEELAAGTRHDVSNELLEISRLAEIRKPTANSGGVRVSMPKLPKASKRPGAENFPWQIAVEAARNARKKWGLGGGPVSNKSLANLLDMPANYLTQTATAKTRIPFGLRCEDPSQVNIYLNRPHPTTRRFALSRLLGDQLHFNQKEKLLPSTDTKTSRQKFQRAFAQEFLCPFDALIDKLGNRAPSEDDISSAADYFDVSPLLVRTTLVNRGQLDRMSLHIC